MKRFWLFIAKITGAEKHIRKSERDFIALQIGNTSHWFSNIGSYNVIMPFLKYIHLKVKNGYYLDSNNARNYVDKLMREHKKGELFKKHWEEQYTPVLGSE